jgi:hypothetical protein
MPYTIAPSATITTVALTTDTSTAVTAVRWEGDAEGDLVVTYRTGGRYRYADVPVDVVLDVLHAAAECRSIGAAVARAVGNRAGEREPLAGRNGVWVV